MSGEMVERVARALADEYARKTGVQLTVEPYWSPWIVEARAAIAAMREPSETMVRASLACSHDGDGDDLVRRDWRAMIDAALSE